MYSTVCISAPVASGALPRWRRFHSDVCFALGGGPYAPVGLRSLPAHWFIRFLAAFPSLPIGQRYSAVQANFRSLSNQVPKSARTHNGSWRNLAQLDQRRRLAMHGFRCLLESRVDHARSLRHAPSRSCIGCHLFHRTAVPTDQNPQRHEFRTALSSRLSSLAEKAGIT